MHLSCEGSFGTFLKACLKTSFMKAGVSPAGLISRQDALLCALKLKPPEEKPTGLSKSIKGRIRLGFHLKGVGGSLNGDCLLAQDHSSQDAST